MAYVVEMRGPHFFVVDSLRRWELAPVFDHLVSAEEIARKATWHKPFFDNIPVCKTGSSADNREGARPLSPAENATV